MKHSTLRVLLLAGLLTAFAQLTSAASVEGKVSAVAGNNITITFDSGAKPKAGDEVEIFFKLAGLDEEVSVATGKVTSVSGPTAGVAIQNGTGTVAKDQLARITSAGTAKTLSTPSNKAATSSIHGDWVGTPSGGTLAISLKEDGTFLMVEERADSAISSGGKYRIDAAGHPQGIELFDLEEKELIGEALPGIFELQSDGRLKLDFSIGQQEQGSREFTDGALVLSRATAPIVRSTKPKPTPYVASTPPPEEALITKGTALYNSGDDTGAIAALEEAIALNPKNPYAFYWRGSCLARKEDFKGAIADWERAMKLDPGMKLEDLIEKTKAVMKPEEKKK